MPLRNTAPEASPRRHSAAATLRAAVRTFAPALALGVAGLTVACADGPTAPAAGAAAAAAAPASTTTYGSGSTYYGGTYGGTYGTTTSGSNLVSVTALKRTTPLAASITRSITLTGTGGTLQIPEAGLTLTIPRGAVGDTTVRITATALAGSAVAYEFQPHGAKFATRLKVLQALSNTTWAANTGTMLVSAGYFADRAQVNTSTGSAQVNETFAGSVAGNTFSFDVAHFSGYIMTSGRR